MSNEEHKSQLLLSYPKPELHPTNEKVEKDKDSSAPKPNFDCQTKPPRFRTFLE
jgi:hypothetical protein